MLDTVMKISIRRYRSTGSIRNSIKKRIVSSKSFIPILFVVSVIALACIHVWQRVYVIQLIGEVEEYRDDNRKLVDLLKKSKVEAINLTRLSRLEKISSEELGLSHGNFHNMYTLKLDNNDYREQGIDEVVKSLKKLADNLPIVSETRAETIELFEE